MSNQDTIYLKNIHIKNTEIREDTIKIRGQLDTIISQGGGGGGGGTGLSLESTQLEVLSGITSGFEILHNDLTNQLTVNTISNYALETTQDSILTNIANTMPLFTFEPLGGVQNNALKTRIENFPTLQGITGVVDVGNFPSSFEVSNFPTEQSITGMVSVSNTSFEVSNFPSSFQVSNFPLTQQVLVSNSVDVNVLNTNSTVYDLTNDSATMTENDSRFEADRVRPDSWAFSNTKNQNGSNVYWYSNSSTSPLGVQEFPILHGDLSSLYCVVSINKTEDNNRLPLMALFSPSQSAFYTSRWIYTVSPTEQLLQTEKVLLYWNIDPVDLYPNLRHIELLKNVVASDGPQLETETVFLMSVNTTSAEPAGSISYNLYNAGFVLNNGVHNDYEFNSGIKSKANLALSKLQVQNNLLGVSVNNTVDCGITDATYTTTDNLSCLNTFIKGGEVSVKGATFGDIDNISTKGLNVISRDAFEPTVLTYIATDVDGSGNLPNIDLRAFNKLSIFGVSTHTGPGSHNIQIQYSSDGAVFYDSPNVIPTNGSGNFSYDNSTFCVKYIRLHFQVAIQTLTCIISLK
jgi:hypothetical protein